MRVKPPLAVVTPFGSKWLRSTWFLRNGSWLKVEDRVDPGLQCERIDGWVERAVSSYRLLYRRGSNLHDNDQFMSGPGMLTCSPCWPRSLKSCRTSALN